MNSSSNDETLLDIDYRQVWRLSLSTSKQGGMSRLGSKLPSRFLQFGRDLAFYYQEGK